MRNWKLFKRKRNENDRDVYDDKFDITYKIFLKLPPINFCTILITYMLFLYLHNQPRTL